MQMNILLLTPLFSLKTDAYQCFGIRLPLASYRWKQVGHWFPSSHKQGSRMTNSLFLRSHTLVFFVCLFLNVLQTSLDVLFLIGSLCNHNQCMYMYFVFLGCLCHWDREFCFPHSPWTDIVFLLLSIFYILGHGPCISWSLSLLKIMFSLHSSTCYCFAFLGSCSAVLIVWRLVSLG